MSNKRILDLIPESIRPDLIREVLEESTLQDLKMSEVLKKVPLDKLRSTLQEREEKPSTEELNADIEKWAKMFDAFQTRNSK